MALIQSPSSLTTKPYHHHLPHTPPLFHISTGTHFTVKSQTPSEPSKPAAEATQVPPKKPTSAGTGFGSPPPSPAKPYANPAADKKKGNRAAVIRRSPVEKLLLYSEEDEDKTKEMVGARRCYSSPRPYSRRIGLPARRLGQVPCEVFISIFTPTVGLFVAGSVVYGVVKYLQNEELKENETGNWTVYVCANDLEKDDRRPWLPCTKDARHCWYFLWDYRVLKTFAKHYSTGETIPKKLVESMQGARKMFAATELQRQIFYAAIDQTFFGEQPSAPTSSIVADLKRQYTSWKHVEDTHWETRFSHLLNYGAGYYSYLYARCFAATIWQKLCHEDPLSLTTGTALRTKLLQHGGAKDPADLLNGLVGDGILRDCNGGIVPDITCLCDEMKLGVKV